MKPSFAAEIKCGGKSQSHALADPPTLATVSTKKPKPPPPKAKKPVAPPPKTAPAKRARTVTGRPDSPPPREKQPRAAAAKVDQRPTVEECTPLEETFLAEYMKDLNGTQAYMRIKPGVKADSAGTLAATMLGKMRVQTRLAELRKAQMARLEIDADAVLREQMNIALADHRELSEYHVDCCRHCYGKDHRYQRTAGEMERDREAHEEAEDAREERAEARGRAYVRRPFDEKGGIGFDGRKPPNIDCPGCFGRGVGVTVIRDTRYLSVAAASLYAGMEETKEGLKIKAHSKMDALEKLNRHLGLYEADNRQKPERDTLGAAELATLYAEAMAAAEAQREEMRRRREKLEALDKADGAR